MGELYEVVALGLNLRTAPVSGDVVSVLPKGQIVEKIGGSDRPDWWRVSTSVGRMTEEGYLSSKHVLAVDPKPSGFRFTFLADLTASFARVQQFVGPYASLYGSEMLPQLNQVLAKYGINRNTRRFTHFLAQIAHESGHFRSLEENLKYSGERLWQVFRKYFKDEAEAMSFDRQPERIANRVYSNRMGNGDEASGDGWRYRGRGFIQLTGRDNYREIGRKIGVDIEANPDLVASDVTTALLVSAAFWDSRKLNAAADKDDLREITRRINGGFNGLADREKLLKRARSIWGA
ncbi:SH3 domain-containing protein [bacterium]|nr:SH3 domain-containing protein [bacterium]